MHRGDPPFDIQLRLEGYLPQTRTITSDESVKLFVSLAQLPPVAPRVESAVRPAPGPRRRCPRVAAESAEAAKSARPKESAPQRPGAVNPDGIIQPDSLKTRTLRERLGLGEATVIWPPIRWRSWWLRRGRSA